MPSLLLLQTGGTDNLLLQAGTDALLLQADGAGVVPTYSYAGTPYSKTQGTAIGNVDPTKDAGDDATSCALTSGSLPAGISLDTTGAAAVGRLSGTPSVSGTYVLGITFTNGAGAGPETTVTLNIAVAAAPTALSYADSPATDAVGVAASHSKTGGVGYAVVFTITPALPTGMSINSSTGAITGTPSVSWKQRTHVVTATNPGGAVNANFVLQCPYIFGVQCAGSSTETCAYTLYDGGTAGGAGGRLLGFGYVGLDMPGQPLGGLGGMVP